MSVTHSWFQSGCYSILAHIDTPPGPHIGRGVIIVPSFGWEDVCAWRSLRYMARKFAARGIPALRFDLPGTGDSSGDAHDPVLVDSWIQSVAAAARELRARTGVGQVDAVGIHLGAMLTVAAASSGAELGDLVVWGGSAVGRKILREWKALRNLEVSGSGDMQASAPEGTHSGLDVLGFVLNPDTQQALDNFDVSALPGMDMRRVLLLSRDNLPPDRKLVNALQSCGCTVTVQCGNGYADMLALPHETAPPVETTREIVAFLAAQSEPRPSAPSVAVRNEDLRPAVRTSISVGIAETIYTVPDSQGAMFGVFASAESRAGDACAVFLNPGAVRHIGPNRMWVEAARRWASNGIASVRIDLPGIGESDGDETLDVPALYSDALVRNVDSVLDSLQSGLNMRRFVVIGLCSGAFLAFQAALRNSRIRGAMLLNPRLLFWDPEIDKRRLMRRTLHGLADPAEWRRLVRGDVQTRTIRKIGRLALDRLRERRNGETERQIDPVAIEQAHNSLERNGAHLSFLFSDGEPLLREMEEEGQLELLELNPRVHCIRVGDAGHTFRPLWAQERVHQLMDRELEAMLAG